MNQRYSVVLIKYSFCSSISRPIARIIGGVVFFQEK